MLGEDVAGAEVIPFPFASPQVDLACAAVVTAILGASNSSLDQWCGYGPGTFPLRVVTDKIRRAIATAEFLLLGEDNQYRDTVLGSLRSFPLDPSAPNFSAHSLDYRALQLATSGETVRIVFGQLLAEGSQLFFRDACELSTLRVFPPVSGISYFYVQAHVSARQKAPRLRQRS